MESAALDTDQWLKDNAFHCIRLDAKISKSACAGYRAENQDQIKNLGNVESSKKITIPGCCQDCPQADGELLESKYKTRFTANLYPKRKQKQKPIEKVEKLAPDIVPTPKIKEDKMADKKTGECSGTCGRKDIVIIGRGLCSKCYYHARKNEKTGQKTVKEAAADQPAIDPKKYKAAEAAVEKMGIKMKVPFDGLDSVPFSPDFPPLQAGERVVNVCRECGCTELDCSVCIEKTGQPCYWVEPDLCSACVPNWIPCDRNGEILGAFDMGPYTLAPGERLVAQREETEAVLLNDLTVLEFDNVASVTKILRVGGHEIERTTVYKNESSGPSGLQRYLPAIVAPIVISALILIHPEYWKHFIFVSIQVGALFTFLESRKKKG